MENIDYTKSFIEYLKEDLGVVLEGGCFLISERDLEAGTYSIRVVPYVSGIDPTEGLLPGVARFIEANEFDEELNNIKEKVDSILTSRWNNLLTGEG